MIVRRGAVLVVAVLSTPAAATVNHPFASHPLTYAAGSIRPDDVAAEQSGACGVSLELSCTARGSTLRCR